MKRVVNTYQGWRQTRLGLLAFMVLFLGLTYAMASWAIDSGSLWIYGATIAALWLAVDALVRAVKLHRNGK